MTSYQWAGLMVSILAVIVIPFVVATSRGSARWARVESKLDNVVNDVKDIKDDMKADRSVNNDRLTWLERNLWERKGPKDAVQSSTVGRQLGSRQQRNQ